YKSGAFEVDYYGASYTQLHLMNVDSLHKEGFDGGSTLIAVLDEGFLNVNTLQAFDHLYAQGKVLDVYNFVDKHTDVYSMGSHGTKVLSCMGAKLEGKLIGACYNANYALYRTEDPTQENPVEEFYYLMAAERADSLGVDIINSSLSYRDFDDPAFDHSYQELNGRHSVAARAVTMLARKGVVVVTSAGNTGTSLFKTIGTPADADSILTVGAVNEKFVRAGFSSVGPTVDGRIKPDVSALGEQAVCVNHVTDGEITTSSGTSFSAPLVAGFVALMKERMPTLSAQELISYVKKSGSNAAAPNNQIGYGVPYYGARETVSHLSDEDIIGYFSHGFLYIKKEDGVLALGEAKECRLYDLSGKLVMATKSLEHQGTTVRVPAGGITRGMYVGFVYINGKTNRLKLIKNN
ncbi:MAG TPA: S8 family serine peptidase, partial [Cytophagales bacterium]|nr:S8 family serine peptidase [Cytophagales bacterium]